MKPTVLLMTLCIAALSLNMPVLAADPMVKIAPTKAKEKMQKKEMQEKMSPAERAKRREARFKRIEEKLALMTPEQRKKFEDNHQELMKKLNARKEEKLKKN